MLLALGCCALAYAPSSLVRAPPPRLTLSSPFPSPDLPEYELPDGAAYQQSSWPVRTMVFIDGTWLYYSLHGRREHCPVTRRFGAGWTYSHHVDYNRLPQLITAVLRRILSILTGHYFDDRCDVELQRLAAQTKRIVVETASLFGVKLSLEKRARLKKL